LEKVFELPNNATETVNLLSEEKFSDVAELHLYVKRALEESHYEKLTLVQSLAIPKIFEGNNVVIKSVTGSGKTLAYLVPIFSNL
jgi:superfamily II DNA/RNA helicase